MPQVLIIESCLVNFGDDRGGVDCAVGEFVSPDKGTALTLAQAGRALYADRKDDPSKAGVHTASAEMLKAAKAMAKGGKAAPVPEQTPADLAQ